VSVNEEPVHERVIRYQRDDSVDPKRKQKLRQEVRLVLRIAIVSAKARSPKAEPNSAQGRQSDYIARRCADS